jgi:glycerophosphoryl diester phosphodiesterase
MSAIRQLRRRGVVCFDIDVFISGDDLLVVGHPANLARRLGLRDVPALTRLALTDIQAAASGGVVLHEPGAEPTVISLQQLLREVRELDIRLVSIEPKDRACSSMGLARLMGAIAASGLESVVALSLFPECEPFLDAAAAMHGCTRSDRLAARPILIGLAVRSPMWRAPETRGTPIESVGVQPSRIDGVATCSAAANASVRFAFSFPAHDAVSHASLGRSRAHRQSVVAWVVDDVETAQRMARARVHAIVSNRPLAIMLAWDRGVAPVGPGEPPALTRPAAIDAWRRAGAGSVVCFDVDSTVVSSEGLDRLAAFAGVPVARIAAITDDAMGGAMPFERALEQRLELVRPSAALLKSAACISPHSCTAARRVTVLMW